MQNRHVHAFDRRALDQDNCFRQTFLTLLEPDQAAAFVAVGRTLIDWACEAGFAGRSEGSLYEARLRAAVADLQFLANCLGELAAARHFDVLTPRDERLVLGAATARRSVDRIVTRLSASLEGDPLSSLLAPPNGAHAS